jgi:ribosomal-protein-alanine N-acetyltransferase
MDEEIIYTYKKSTQLQIFYHLHHCQDSFIPPLGETVNIFEYSEKLRNLADTFEAWSCNELIGLIALYINDQTKEKAFITNVSVYPEHSGKGIGKQLMLNALDMVYQLAFNRVSLEVHKDNKAALELYRKFNFEPISEKDEKLTLELDLNIYEQQFLS